MKKILFVLMSGIIFNSFLTATSHAVENKSGFILKKDGFLVNKVKYYRTVYRSENCRKTFDRLSLGPKFRFRSNPMPNLKGKFSVRLASREGDIRAVKSWKPKKGYSDKLNFNDFSISFGQHIFDYEIFNKKTKEIHAYGKFLFEIELIMNENKIPGYWKSERVEKPEMIIVRERFICPWGSTQITRNEKVTYIHQESDSEVISNDTSVVTPRIVRFNNPMAGGYGLDYCREWAKNCGLPAATAYCQLKGYNQAINYRWVQNNQKTRVINGGQVCDAEFCDRIVMVDCKSAGN